MSRQAQEAGTGGGGTGSGGGDVDGGDGMSGLVGVRRWRGGDEVTRGDSELACLAMLYKWRRGRK